MHSLSQGESTQMLRDEISHSYLHSVNWMALNWLEIWAAFLQSTLSVNGQFVPNSWRERQATAIVKESEASGVEVNSWCSRWAEGDWSVLAW